jgi:drug/metabolite transporter (DMT)-like permease
VRRSGSLTPVAALLAGAIVWGLIWYPYRVLAEGGVNGAIATTLTYAGALLLGAIVFTPRIELSSALAAIAITAGWANVGFTMAVIYGEVMRVVLLFYLAPVWTMLFARLLLHERLSPAGLGLMMVALAGAIMMLWQPQLDWPLPRNPPDWWALSAGAMFALSNVLIRRSPNIQLELRMLAVFAGCVAVGIGCLVVSDAPPIVWTAIGYQTPMLTLLAVVILAVNFAAQYGLTKISANRAIVIYLFELVVTAISTWLLADEALSLKEWCGGAMIIAAALLSDRLTGGSKATLEAG